MRQELYFTAFGIPAPQGSKNVYQGRVVESSKKLKPWRKAIADGVFRAMMATGDERSFTEPVVVYATFYLPRPKSVKRLLPSVPPDLDKLCRSLGDALSVDTAIVENDSQIVRWVASKVYADDHDAGVRVGIRVATPEELKRSDEIANHQSWSSSGEVCEVCGK